MSDADSGLTVARVVVSIIAGIVIAAAFLAMFLVYGFSGMCVSMGEANRADCEFDVVESFVRGGISVVLAIGAILVATRAKTAGFAGGGGILLVIAAAVPSPAWPFLGG
jgi:hypothetical protein